MAGVASPMWDRNPADGGRLLAGLSIGGIAAALVLSAPIYVIGSTLQWALPLDLRFGMAMALSALFGILDIANLTPQARRQVPEEFIWRLTPGRLGLVWGFDLGLWVTTQKSTSLIWAATITLALLRPSWIPLLLSLMVMSSTSVVAFRVFADHMYKGHGAMAEARWYRRAKRWSGISLVVLSAVMAAVSYL